MTILHFNEEERQFEKQVGEHIVFAKIREHEGTYHINHVEAPAALRGTGEAGAFMKDLMEHLREKNVKVYPLCGYAVHWLNKHDEYNDMVV